jgi:hypothetical protein
MNADQIRTALRTASIYIGTQDNEEIEYWVEAFLLDLVDDDEDRAIEILENLIDHLS